MDNSTSTQLQGDLLLMNQLELVAPTTVAGTLYGIGFTLFCLYVHSLVPQLRNIDIKRHAIFMLGYSIVIMLCGLYNLVYNAWVTQDAYIKHSNYPGGPYIYIIAGSAINPIKFVGFCQASVHILTGAIQVHIHFSKIYPTNWLNSEQGLACMGRLECHSICQFRYYVAFTMFLDLRG
jgi:hypothetical protein